jgi:branched-subunit amino acid aminotransferase/4-amino-4-deoxychorismate lyase
LKSWRLAKEQWTACSELPLADRGFRYGMSVFETIGVFGGRPLLMEPHQLRLKRAASDAGMPCPALPALDFSYLGTGLLRFYITAGAGAPLAPLAGNVYAIYDDAEVGWNFAPLRGMTSAAPYLPRPGGWKTGNYWQNIDALTAAQQSGCDEALLFNPAGMLVSGSMANVFLEYQGEWVTPALETGARDGAVREWAVTNTGAREDFLDSEAVWRCTACFLTNSRFGLRSLSELDGRALRCDIATLQQSYFHDVFHP